MLPSVGFSGKPCDVQAVAVDRIAWCPTVWALQFPKFQYLWYVWFNEKRSQHGIITMQGAHLKSVTRNIVYSGLTVHIMGASGFVNSGLASNRCRHSHFKHLNGINKGSLKRANNGKLKMSRRVNVHCIQEYILIPVDSHPLFTRFLAALNRLLVSSCHA